MDELFCDWEVDRLWADIWQQEKEVNSINMIDDLILVIAVAHNITIYLFFYTTTLLRTGFLWVSKLAEKLCNVNFYTN